MDKCVLKCEEQSETLQTNLRKLQKCHHVITANFCKSEIEIEGKIVAAIYGVISVIIHEFSKSKTYKTQNSMLKCIIFVYKINSH